jgi:hypothetical protein
MSRRATALVALIALAACASASSSPGRAAGDTVIGFEDLAPGTTVTTQYAGKGITFDQNAQGAPDAIGTLVIESVGSSGAHSGAQVGNIRTGVNEFPSGNVWGHFSVPREHVSLYVGQDVAQSTRFTLEAFDVAGQAIPGLSTTATVPASQSTQTQLSVSAPSAEIYSFHVSANSNVGVVDDVSFDSASTPPPPDFGLSASGTNGVVALRAGETAKTTLGLARNVTSTGRIGLSVAGLPSGVTATVDPNPSTKPGPQPVTVAFTAAADAPAESDVPVTVTAQPLDPTAGIAARSVKVSLTVQGTYELIATGLEVTQGTQYLQVPMPGPDPSMPVAYTGVKLTSWKPTFVRLFVDAADAPLLGVSDVGALLYGYDEDGRPLPGSPLSGTTLRAQDMRSTQLRNDQRVAGSNTITFGPLPPTWTAGGVRRFRAVLAPPPPALAGAADDSVECSTNDCKLRLALEVGGIRFYQSYGGVGISVVNLDVKGLADPPDNPYRYLPLARQLSPVNLIPEGPIASVDITDIWGEKGWSDDERNDKAEDVISLLQDLADEYPTGSALMGVANQDASGHDLGMETGGPVSSGDEPVMVVNFNRPLTSVAHELGHAFGRLHASSGCLGGANGQKAEPWPDATGTIAGVGTNIVPSSLDIPLPLPLGKTYYDFMSYCANDSDAWISPKGWDEVMDWASGHIEGSTDRSVQQSEANAGGSTMRVIAVADMNGTRITEVRPGSLAPDGRRLPVTPFRLLVRNGAGKLVATAPFHGTVGGHVDGRGGQPFTLLVGQVSAAGAQTVEVSEAGKIVATKTRPADRLAVRLVAPAAHARLGGSKRVKIRWRTRATGKLRLTATVEYSADAGGSWKPVWMGPNAGGVVFLSPSLFPFSRQARIRVLVSDGFNQAQAVSGPLRSAGRPPHVYIVSPAPGAALSASQRVTLGGQAVDDSFHPIAARALVWSTGRKRLGVGTSLTVQAKELGSGPVVVTLRARDNRHRIGAASIRVTVRP